MDELFFFSYQERGLDLTSAFISFLCFPILSLSFPQGTSTAATECDTQAYKSQGSLDLVQVRQILMRVY